MHLSGLIFIKILRLICEHHFLTNQSYPDHAIFCEILNDELHILSKLWSLKRDDILKIGKELVRLIIPLAKANIPEINSIMEDISKRYNNDISPLYIMLLNVQQPSVGA